MCLEGFTDVAGGSGSGNASGNNGSITCIGNFTRIISLNTIGLSVMHTFRYSRELALRTGSEMMRLGKPAHC